MSEEWKDVVVAKDNYEISSYGRIRNKNTKEILKFSTTGGYAHIELRYGINKCFSIHRLVADAFVKNPYNFPIINHKDENKLNNKAENLEWCTYQYNNRYGKNAVMRNSRVIQYDMSGNAMKIWESIKEASENTGLKYQGISMCCRLKRKSCGEYMWSFANLEKVRKYLTDRKEKT